MKTAAPSGPAGPRLSQEHPKASEPSCHLQRWWLSHRISDLPALSLQLGCGSLNYPGRPGHYIDIIPERVSCAEFLYADAYTGAEGDAEWKKKVRVIAELRDDLPPPLLTALRQEYGLEPGMKQRTRPVRYALAEYVKEALIARRIRGWGGPVWRAEVEISPERHSRRCQI